MPPRIDPIQIRQNQLNNDQINFKKNDETNAQQVPHKTVEQNSSVTRQSDLKSYNDQQKERLERLFGAGAAGQASSVDLYKRRAFEKAAEAYHQKINEGFANFPKSGDVPTITNNALKEYRNVLAKFKVNPNEARTPSVLRAVDFLQTDATRPGGFFTLGQNALRSLAQGGEKPQYLVRMLWTGPGSLDQADARLAYYDGAKKQGKTIAWTTTVEDLAGAKLDYQEVMRRVGWTAEQIADAKPSEFKIVVINTDAVKDFRIPTTQAIIDQASGDKSNFKDFQKEKPAFWEKVLDYNYEAKLAEAKAQGLEKNIDEFIKTLPADEKRLMKARSLMERSMGVNPLFTGDGTTKRPDNINGKVGVREYIVDNIDDSSTLRSMAEKGQVAFLDLQDLKVTDKTPIATQNKSARLPEVSRGSIIRSEMKTGAIGGAIFSAGASLNEVYGQVREGNYVGASQTFVTNTVAGAALGSVSSAGERMIGNSIEQSLSRSATLTRNLDKVYQNGVGKQISQRLLGAEATATSQLFGGAARQVIGRLAGGSIVGGAVNGAFSSYDQIQAYRRGEVSASQAIGTVSGEVGVGLGAGMAGAATGALIGSVIPGAGTIVGGVIGFAVGVGVGVAADYGLRRTGVDKFIARNVTSLIDNAPRMAAEVKQFGANALDAGKTLVNQKIDQARGVYNRVSEAGKTAQNFVNQKIEVGKQKVSQATEAVVQFASTTKQRAVRTVNNAVNTVKTQASAVYNRAATRVNSGIAQARAVYSKASSAGRAAQAFVGQKYNQAKQTVSHAATAAVNYAAQVKNNAASMVRNTASAVYNRASSAVTDTVSNAASSIRSAAAGGLKSVFGW